MEIKTVLDILCSIAAIFDLEVFFLLFVSLLAKYFTVWSQRSYFFYLYLKFF